MSSTPGTASPSVATNQAAASSPATTAANTTAAPANTFKVFAGNLSFKTREEELKKAFSAAGNVISANIITRGPRSLGYGFVEFATEAEAKKSVTLLNKKELDGRDINVEVAKTRDESAVNKPAAKASPSTGANNNNNNNKNNNNNNNSNNAGGEFRGQRSRGGPRVAGRGYLRRRGDSSGGAAGANNNVGGGFVRPRGALGARRPNTGANNAGGAGANNGAGRAPQKDENKAPRTPSANTLFVANLPFSVTDKELQEIFQGFAVNSAHVVVKRNGRSKGFGFVEFKTSDDQQKALAATDKKQVQGRELIVKVALTEQVNEAKATEAAEKKDTPAENKAASPATPAAEKK